MTVDKGSDWETDTWITGEDYDYTAWYKGEPSGDNEVYLAMFLVDDTWYYNDTENEVDVYTGKKGYIIEYEPEDEVGESNG